MRHVDHNGDSAGPGLRPAAHFWAHVTAFGALWGVVEITLGAFLHTLRVPFVGVVMASTSAALLVGQRQLLPRRGVSVATGVVAALCKSISPGGIILGPMIGIFTEALLVELSLLLAPRRLVSAMLAGALCTLWSAFQGLLTQYLLYGGRIVDLYLAALGHASRWLHLSPGTGWWGLALLSTVVGLVGAVGAVAGRRVGIDSGRRLFWVAW